MKYLLLMILLVVISLSSGCVSENKNITSTQTTMDPTLDTSTITHAEWFASVDYWDTAKFDGVLLSIAFLDQDNSSVLVGREINFPIDIEVWNFKKGTKSFSISDKDQKIYSESTTLEHVDSRGSFGNTKIFGNTRLRIAYNELKGYESVNRLNPSMVAILMKVHLPDGRTIEAYDTLYIPPSSS